MSRPDVGSTVQKLRAGTDDDDTPEANATVNLNGCTGTLIAPDLVITAGHCVAAHGSGVRDPWRAPAGSRCTDREVPGRWYPVDGNVPRVLRVGVGPDSARFRFTTTGVDYTIPGCSDVLLLRLAAPVPAAVATPVKVLTALGERAGAGDAEALAGAELGQAGWGQVVDGGPGTPVRQRGSTRYAGLDGEFITTGGRATDTLTLPGDSGGPLYWTHPSGQRYVVGVCRGYLGNLSRYTATFHRSTRREGVAVPGVGDFLTMVAPEAVAAAPRVPGPAGTLALTSWWSPERKDNQLTTDPRMIGAPGTVRGPDYRYVGCEGHVFHPGLPAPRGTVPLHRWWDPERKDNHTSSEAFMARWPGDGWHRDPDYGYSRLEGYVFSVEYPQPAGTIPLLKWWSPGRKDNWTTTQHADLAERGEGLGPDYVRPRTIGYVYPA